MSKHAAILEQLATELQILYTAWFICDDDNRRRKQLSVSPAVARRWSRLIKEARKAVDEAPPRPTKNPDQPTAGRWYER